MDTKELDNVEHGIETEGVDLATKQKGMYKASQLEEVIETELAFKQNVKKMKESLSRSQRQELKSGILKRSIQLVSEKKSGLINQPDEESKVEKKKIQYHDINEESQMAISKDDSNQVREMTEEEKQKDRFKDYDNLIIEEDRKKGKVDWSIYFSFVQSSGGFWFWSVILGINLIWICA